MVPEEMMQGGMPPEDMPPDMAPQADLGAEKPSGQHEETPSETETPVEEETDSPTVVWAEAKVELMERWGVKPNKFPLYLENIGLTEQELRKVVEKVGGTPTPEDIREASMRKAYRELWGEEPPDSVIKDAVGMGMNRKQFELTQKADPAFKRTRAYKEEFDTKANELAEMMRTGGGR